MLRIITIKDMVLFMYKKIIQNITILLPIITLIYAISLLFPYYIHDNEFFSINYFNHYKATMMLVPTFSVICSLLLSKKKLPYSIYIIYIIYILYTIWSFLLVFFDCISLGNIIEKYYDVVTLLFSALILLFIYLAPSNIRAKYGFGFTNILQGIIIIILFLFLYSIQSISSYLIDNYTYRPFWEVFFDFDNCKVAISILFSFPLWFFSSYLFYFGEEYCWRFFLQNILQKKFGLRLGVIILGLIWGTWHLPLDMLESQLISSEIPSFVVWLFRWLIHIVVCTSLSIFLGWVYIKTKNIWIVCFLHFLHNNLMVIFVNNIGELNINSGVFSDYLLSLLFTFLAYVLCFGSFIFSKCYNQENLYNEVINNEV